MKYVKLLERCLAYGECSVFVSCERGDGGDDDDDEILPGTWKRV